MGQTDACGLCMVVGTEVVSESQAGVCTGPTRPCSILRRPGGQRRAGLFSTHGGEVMMA